MKRLLIATLVMLTAGAAFSVPARAQDGPKNWEAFSRQLVEAVRHPNLGVKCAALQHIIHYGDSLDVRAAVFDVTRMYRSHQHDENTRILAMVALSRMNSSWAMDLLKRSVRFEDSPRVRQHLIAVVNGEAQPDLPQVASQVE